MVQRYHKDGHVCHLLFGQGASVSHVDSFEEMKQNPSSLVKMCTRTALRSLSHNIPDIIAGVGTKDVLQTLGAPQARGAQTVTPVAGLFAMPDQIDRCSGICEAGSGQEEEGKDRMHLYRGGLWFRGSES